MLAEGSRECRKVIWRSLTYILAIVADCSIGNAERFLVGWLPLCLVHGTKYLCVTGKAQQY